MTSLEHMPDGFMQSVAGLGIDFDENDIPKLALFLDVLLETNRLFNLTAIKDPSVAWTRHILDSLSLLPCLAKEDVANVIDIGSGGGLPAIPLAITMPDVTFLLVESTKKKAVFLSHVVEQLALDNVTVLAERAENLAAKGGGFRGSADAVIARAVGSLAVLLELTVPFAKVGGVVISIKGEKATQEIEDAQKALHTLHGEVESKERTETGTILIIRKLAKTPVKYPRVAGEPKRSPIGKRAN